jgi:glyoxylate/hydroxypyruvate reductase A
MLPLSIPLFRLEDTGMGLQMQEYAVSQVLHWFRRFDDYQALKQRPAGSRWRSIARRFHHRHYGRGRAWRESGGSLQAGVFRYASGAAAANPGRRSPALPEKRSWAFLNGTRVLINLLPNTAETVGIINSARWRSCRITAMC